MENTSFRLESDQSTSGNNLSFSLKQLALRIAVSALAIGMFTPMLPASSADAGDVINYFRSTIVLNKDSTLFVKETIDVDFGTNKHHGIFREIPCTAVIKNDKKRIHIRPIESSCDRKKVPNSISLENDNFRIKIGDPDKTISGEHQYTIEYNVYGAVRLSKDNPEVYWNVTGNDWKMPIKKAMGTMVLPKDIPGNTVHTVSFAGPIFSRNPARTESFNRSIQVSAGDLAPGSGLTLAASLPPNSVSTPGLINEWTFYLGEAGLFIASIVAFIAGIWPIALLCLLLVLGLGSKVQNGDSNVPFWDGSGSSSLDFGCSDGGFGGGGGDTW